MASRFRSSFVTFTIFGCASVGGLVACRAIIGATPLEVGPSDGGPTDPDAPGPSLGSRALAVTESYACALHAGNIECLGLSAYGQIPGVDGGTTHLVFPLGPGGSATFPAVAIGASPDFMCGISPAGSTYCAGFSNWGILGGSDLLHGTPVAGERDMGTLVDLAVGETFTCGRNTVGEVFCWGDHAAGTAYGQLTSEFDQAFGFDGGKQYDDHGFPIGALKGALQVSLGAAHGCALMPDRSVVCWGRNDFRQTGQAASVACATHGTTPNPCVRALTSVPGLPKVKQIAAGAMHTCVLDLAGKPYCWGRSDSGQLGTAGVGTQQCTTDGGDAAPPVLCTEAPQLVPGIEGATSIAVGAETSCAIVAGQVYCWGANDSDVLGRGDTASSAPGKVEVEFGRPLGGVESLSMGGSAACALTTDGTMYCWGSKLGDNGNLPRATALPW